MHIVTRTLSNPPSLSGTPSATPSIAMRKLAALNNNNNKVAVASSIPDDDNSVFKPSTHVMRREDSALGNYMTPAQLRQQELHHRVNDGHD